MDYHLRVKDQDAGIFPLEELRRRRLAGELTGQEAVWCQGMAHWQSLDSVLSPSVAAAIASARPGLPAWAVILMIVGILGSLLTTGWFAHRFLRTAGKVSADLRQFQEPPGLETAKQPIVFNPKSLTAADVRKMQRAFRVRHYIDAYVKHGRHGQPSAQEGRQFLESWIQYAYGGDNTNLPGAVKTGDKIAADPACNDPVLLLAAAAVCEERSEQTRRYERALAAFDDSDYEAYPKFYVTVTLGQTPGISPQQQAARDASAVRLFGTMLKSGELDETDQPEIANSLLLGWGESFFHRNSTNLCLTADSNAKRYPWLAAVMDGQREIIQAWQARGSGFADTVTPQGWVGFETFLTQASNSLSAAWSAHPEWPMAPSMMIKVSMGLSGAQEMRTWFDRATTAQIDYEPAWYSMRWGLRPRWCGSLEAMEALGIAAINTGRFDTDVPQEFYQIVQDLEQEGTRMVGRHDLYGRRDIWPQFQRLYEGYIAHYSPDNAGWRSPYAVVAYFAGHYDVARQQLEKLDWKLLPRNQNGWGTDVSLMPLEVAACTGPSSNAVNIAETARQQGHTPKALRLYQKLAAEPQADAMTSQFIRTRVASLQFEERLRTGDWLPFHPDSDDDPNWVFGRGQYKELPDGDLEVHAGPDGHLIICRARVGQEFEVEGEFEVVHSSNKDFQAGMVFGLPNLDDNNWYAFRLSHNQSGPDAASFSVGWLPTEMSKTVSLQERRNTFHLRLQGGAATAWVNGRPVFTGVRGPGYIYACVDEFRMGLGAWNDMNDTVIRYHDVKIRKLAHNPPAAAVKANLTRTVNTSRASQR